MEQTLIRNGKIITQNRIVEGDLLIKDGRIAAVIEGSGGEIPPGTEPVDAGGLYVSPGFIDIHNHGRLGASVNDGTEAALETIAAGQLARGVTGFLAGPSTLPWERYLEVIRVSAGYCEGPRENRSQCLGLYLEGVFFSQERRGAHMAQYLRPPSEADLEAVLDAGGRHIKAAALSPELPGALAAVERLCSRGIVAAAAHSDANFNQAMAGINGGISLSTHTFNGMRPLSHHDPGITGAVLVDDRVTCELIADGIHLEGAVLELAFRIKGPDRIALVSDSVAFNGMKEGTYPYRNQTVTISGGTVRLADGRLAGSCLSLDRAVRNMTVLAGASLCEAVRMASLVPARIAGLADRKGSITAGKDADIIFFDDQVNVREVFIGGKRCPLR